MLGVDSVFCASGWLREFSWRTGTKSQLLRISRKLMRGGCWVGRGWEACVARGGRLGALDDVVSVMDGGEHESDGVVDT